MFLFLDLSLAISYLDRFPILIIYFSEYGQPTERSEGDAVMNHHESKCKIAL